ncbi:Islet cell autoantigen 1 [Fasciolopsis buskii]|uniref:Islet cell autoantigen 1 n=1 Tax=Fasciolopsis buskii TaxID=27845 RepID=A0A8E0VIG7_9TREM|nr:Islet cell autoantigen 1 [Fasciolopsis buski]
MASGFSRLCIVHFSFFPYSWIIMTSFLFVFAPQVRKSKSTFDRLKIDSMQKIDLLSASRCNMLSHVLAAYQNSLLNFLEKTSRTMVAVAERFKGYQYYEFSVLKHLRPDSRKLAGRGEDSGDEDSTSSLDEESDSILAKIQNEDADGVGCAHSPPSGSSVYAKQGYCPLSTVGEPESPYWSRTQTSDVRPDPPDSEKDGDDQPIIELQESAQTEEELDRKLDELFRADDTDESKIDEFAQFQSYQSKLSSADQPSSELLAGADGGVPAEHRDFLTDLFATNNTSQPVNDSKNWLGQLLTSSADQKSQASNFASEWNSVFNQLGNDNNNTALQSNLTPSASDSNDPWTEFERNNSSVLPSKLLDQRHQQMQQPSDPTALPNLPVGPMDNCLGDPHGNTSLHQSGKPLILQAPGTTSSMTASSISSRPEEQRQPTSLGAWISLFSDLDPLGNPDSLSKKEGQISDA